jgi:hypothetical protein
MSTSYTNNKQIALQGTGDNSNTWGSVLNTSALTVIDTNLGGRLSLSLSSTSTTLTATQAQNVYYTFTGTLTANSTVYWPATAGGSYVIYNNTSGSYTLTVAPTGGTGISIAQGYTDTIFINPDTVTAVAVKNTNATLNVSGNATVGGTLGVTGATTLAANATVGGTLGVTGATTLAALSATSLDSTPIGLTTPSTAVVTSLNNGYLAGLRNRIINGDFRIDQRNAGSAQTVTNGSTVYTLDRWFVNTTGSNVTVQRVAGSGIDQYVCQITGAASNTAVYLSQRIEATNIYDLANSTVALSVKLANSFLTTVNWSASYPTASDNYAGQTSIASGSFTVTSTLTKYSAQIALPSGAQNGLQITFSVTGQTSGTLTVGEVQIENGAIATPFERRPIGIELGLAQRYYQNTYGLGTVPGTATNTGIVNLGYSYNGSVYFGVGSTFPVQMRVSPSMVFYDGAGNSGNVSQYYSGSWHSSQGAISLVLSGFNSFTAAVSTLNSSVVAAHYTASAEL